eukprot:COSAG06_NODE_40571_length_400_cov_2.744186_1_plen_104_part_01
MEQADREIKSDQRDRDIATDRHGMAWHGMRAELQERRRAAVQCSAVQRSAAQCSAAQCSSLTGLPEIGSSTKPSGPGFTNVTVAFSAAFSSINDNFNGLVVLSI